jgi:hypothetical protein
MDLNVVVVYVSTGRPTPLRQRIWLNLRLDSFSRPNARRQGLCGQASKKRVFTMSGKDFRMRALIHTRRRGAILC